MREVEVTNPESVKSSCGAVREILDTSRAPVVLGLGCTSTTVLLPTVRRIDIPPVGVETSAELGDTILAKGRIVEYDALLLHQAVEFRTTGYRVHIPAQRLVATREDSRWTYYYAVEMYSVGFGLRSDLGRKGGIKISKTDPERVMLFEESNFDQEPSTEVVFERTTAEATNEPSFRQELIYNGRSGDTVKFLYRETIGLLDAVSVFARGSV